MFSTTADALNANESAPEPKLPYAGGMELINVTLEDPSRTEGKSYEVIQFHFKLTEGDQEGKIYRHIEWDPINPKKSDEDNVKRANSCANRIGYMLSYFLKDEHKEDRRRKAASVVKGETWNEFRKSVKNAFDKLDYKDKKDLQGKILGSVYMGKPSLSFPNYLGFLSDSRSNYPVDFQKKEADSNREYMHAIHASPDAPGELDGGNSPLGGGGPAQY